MSLASQYVGDKTFKLADIARTPPGPGEVIVQPSFCGICGTDLHIFHGNMDQRVTMPATIGHEMSGTIAAVGDGVTGWAEGDHVTVLPLDWDGTCPACLAGNEHICQHLNFIGIDSPGGMQQRWKVRGDWLVRLPADLPLDQAALVEPVAVAVHDVQRAGVQAGEKVLVVGCGPIGMLIAIVAREAGADVRLVELNASRRAIAVAHGFTCLEPGADDVAASVEEWTGDAGVPVAFEVSGSQGGVETATMALAVRGRLCLVAVHAQPRQVVLHRFFWRELTLVGTRLYVRADFERAIDLIARGVVPAADLISKTVPLDQVTEAFAALEAGADVMKILVDCQRTSAGIAV
jgi:(R,R)-butanediol dehydrogenase/meso-butanediol dehydrogenase/diacetyl reductase